MKIYLMQGIFFQCGSYTVWSGILSPEPDGSRLVGQIQDLYGEAEVSDVALDEEAGTLSFVKSYIHRGDQIFYRLTRQPDGSWEGSYSGSGTGVDAVRCFLAPVDEKFFVPPVLAPVSAN